MSELARAVRRWLESGLRYNDDAKLIKRRGIPRTCIGACWYLIALPHRVQAEHIDFVERDERVPIPERKRNG